MTTTAEAPAYTVAKRGMVLVRHEHSSYWVNDEPGRGHAVEQDNYTVGVVTSVTREGLVKRYREAGWDSERCGPADARRFRGKVYLAPGMDAEAAMAVAAAHVYPGHSQVMPYASLAEVREALRPCRI